MHYIIVLVIKYVEFHVLGVDSLVRLTEQTLQA
jgi:hypothetical protein